MTTTVVKTIGTGGDYTTLAAWMAACPPNLVTADQIWQGKLKNQEFSGTSALVTIALASGATDATRYIELTTEAGASFVDNASKVGRYDATKGAAIKLTGPYGVGVQVSQRYTRVSKLQFASTSTGNYSAAALNVSTTDGTDCDINQCIVESESASTTLGSCGVDGPGNIIRNTIVIQKKNNASAIIAALHAGASAYNCTFVSTQATLTVGIKGDAGNATLKNCYVGKVTTPVSGTTVFTKTNCYSSASATGFTVAAMSTANFQNVTNGTHDFRLASGSALIGAGVVDSTYSLTDLYDTTRGATNDVGAYQVPASTPATGTISWTEANDTTSITGNIGSGVSGTASWTEANDTASITGSIASPAVTGTASWTEANDTAALTGTIAGAVPTITILAIKNNTGTLRASEVFDAFVYHMTTGALIVSFLAQTSDASANLALASGSMSTSTNYRVVLVDSSGNAGVGTRMAL